MIILYINYWGLEDGLTHSTVLPHLKILSENKTISNIHLITVERDSNELKTELLSKVIHHPIRSANFPLNIINKISDFFIIKSKLREIHKTVKFDLIQCKGALAGTFGYHLHKWSKIPFCVESFEPHADYMLHSGVWGRFDPRYIFQKHWEQKQRTHARMLMPVSHNYKKYLVEIGLPSDSVLVMPCAVDLNSFRFSPTKRINTRENLGIKTGNIVGIYVGKFGGIYMNDDAFTLFERMFQLIPSFHLIILTPDPYHAKKSALEKGLDISKTYIAKVTHDVVSEYLSASDIAISTIKPDPIRMFCSPVKNGEYWANGLPILLPDNIGDDSQIIKETGYGAIFDPSRPDDGVMRILEISHEPREHLSKKIAQLAKENRNFDTCKIVYQTLIHTIYEESSHK